eukprot:CAMPEP_0180304684 /NCGR_PEP_ID=MMETSP0988-20121125/25939_1 /TAXON_ID=697907 /ORGANISM="non described non described, Strain CCMP2293" /LENGTH=177 /DNA_ID=CAMNT_0022286897 /DNA_START=255 /DNA_END=784 /DNA_ORIENTATION=-
MRVVSRSPHGVHDVPPAHSLIVPTAHAGSVGMTPTKHALPAYTPGKRLLSARCPALSVSRLASNCFFPTVSRCALRPLKSQARVRSSKWKHATSRGPTPHARCSSSDQSRIHIHEKNDASAVFTNFLAEAPRPRLPQASEAHHVPPGHRRLALRIAARLLLARGVDAPVDAAEAGFG